MDFYTMGLFVLLVLVGTFAGVIAILSALSKDETRAGWMATGIFIFCVVAMLAVIHLTPTP